MKNLLNHQSRSTSTCADYQWVLLPCSTLSAKALPTSPLAKDPYQGQNKTQGDLALQTVKQTKKEKERKRMNERSLIYQKIT
jgi:hypothetical protein